MCVSKHIVYSLDVASIDNAIRELNEYKQWVVDKLDELCKALADIGVYEIADVHGYTEGGNVQVYAEPIENGYQVVAAGKPVFFLEYGTGEPAGTGAILGTPPVDTAPGSYSDTIGAGTYRAWVDGGMVGEYRYNHAPRAGFYYAYKAISQSVADVARKVFEA